MELCLDLIANLILLGSVSSNVPSHNWAFFEFHDKTIMVQEGDLIFPKVRLLAFTRRRLVTLNCNGDTYTWAAWGKAPEESLYTQPEEEIL